MKKILILALLPILIIFSFVSSAKGERQQTQIKVASIRENVQSALEQRCASIQERIQTRISRYDNNKYRHLKAYNNTKDRITKFVERLTASGYDTSKLKTDLQQFDEKINKFAQDYTAFINKLKETKDFTCGHANGEFLAKLVEARNLMQIVQQDSADIRNFYQTIIRPDIMAIKQQKRSSAATPTSSS